MKDSRARIATPMVATSSPRWMNAAAWRKGGLVMTQAGGRAQLSATGSPAEEVVNPAEAEGVDVRRLDAASELPQRARDVAAAARGLP